MRVERIVTIVGLVLLLFIAFSHKGLLTPQPDLPALTICPEGPPQCDYATLTEAIRAAEPDMTLFVHGGVYEETLEIDKGLRLVGIQGEVLLRGVEPGRPTLTVRPQEASNVLLENLTILGGPAPERGKSDEGCIIPSQGPCSAGLVVEDSAPLVLTLFRVRVKEALAYGLVCLYRLEGEGATVRAYILDSQFKANKGLVWACGGRLSVEEVLFAEGKWGIAIGPGTEATIRNSTFLRNHVGLGVEGDDIRITVENSRFLYNTNLAIAAYGHRFTNMNVELYDNMILGNWRGVSWGGFPGSDPQEILGSRMLIEDSLIVGNAEYGISAWSSAPLLARNNRIEDNGHGVLVFQAEEGVELSSNRIRNNRNWGVALLRVDHWWEGDVCEIAINGGPVLSMDYTIVVRGEGNSMGGNGRGDLCPEDYSWPEDFMASNED